MNVARWIFVIAAVFGIAACRTASDGAAKKAETEVKESLMKAKAGEVEAPVAKVEPEELEKHGHTRVDDYYWLKQRDEENVLAYLNAENDYTEAVTEPVKSLKDKLFQEIKGRIKQDDNSPPYLDNGYYYYTRYATGKDYPIYCRKKGSLDAPEEIMLDANQLAEGHDFFSVGGWTVSEDNRLLAYAEDTVGRRIYTIKVKNLETGEALGDVIPQVTGNLAWANDNQTLFYAKQDPETLRSHRIYRHQLGDDPAQDALVFEESDETFRCGVFKTKSKKYVMIGSFHTLSSEYRFVEADQPAGEFRVLQARQRDHEYNVDHFGDHFYILTNHEATNFRLMKTPVDKPGMANWEEVVAHREDVYLDNFEIFQDYLVLAERAKGLIQLRVMPWTGEGEHYLDFGEPAYAARISVNRDFNTSLLRYSYSSLTTPPSTYDYDMASREKTLIKQTEVLGDFHSDNYVAERHYALMRDGVEAPISLVYRKNTPIDGTAPLLTYGYGSYGISRDAFFSSSVISLLDRGFVYAILHVRGGQEMGRQWYDNGKLFNKMNTFQDYIDCTKYLIEKKFGDKDRVFAYGGSAGGLLMGAIINMEPDLYRGVIAAVPFVDVITTMLDPSIPLTTFEYDEWGDPNNKEYYDYILKYSPYDNVEAKTYPNLLVTTGYHDSQVQYWEPAKWVAKLRARKTGDNVILLKTNMSAGHGGASARDEAYRETALNYAFLLDLAGIRS